jgi:hypothetical protein
VGLAQQQKMGLVKQNFGMEHSWTEVNDLATARRGLGSGTGSPSSAGIVFGGNTPPVFDNVANTEEWTAPDVLINTLTTS